eukprot:m.375104 g.375104  ORF g.375104 m.375104 type:complete len:75 (+) comp75792_c0_seq1:85-309(+)
MHVDIHQYLVSMFQTARLCLYMSLSVFPRIFVFDCKEQQKLGVLQFVVYLLSDHTRQSFSLSILIFPSFSHSVY